MRVTLAEDVAKYLRSSDRFKQRFNVVEQRELLAVVTNFSFAPQRWSSVTNSTCRMALFMTSVMTTIGLEVLLPTSNKRRQWATDLVAKMNGEMVSYQRGARESY